MIDKYQRVNNKLAYYQIIKKVSQYQLTFVLFLNITIYREFYVRVITFYPLKLI